MADPFSLGALGAVALTEGIKFLYDQAKELLKSWRERREDAEASVEVPARRSEVLDASLAPARVPFAVLEEHAAALTALRRGLIEYAEEGRPVDPADQSLLETTEALRSLLELAYGQRITFRGEQREHTGTRVDSQVEAGVVRGRLAGVRAHGVVGDLDVVAKTRVDEVDSDGDVVGVDLDFGRRGKG